MTYLLLFLEFFQTGLFAIGGGYATLPFIQTMMERYPAWFGTLRLADIAAISEATPGPVGVNAAIRPSRKARSPSTGSPLARVGQPSGSAQAGSRARLIPTSGAQEEGNVIVSLLTDPKPEAGISPANSRA